MIILKFSKFNNNKQIIQWGKKCSCVMICIILVIIFFNIMHAPPKIPEGYIEIDNSYGVSPKCLVLYDNQVYFYKKGDLFMYNGKYVTKMEDNLSLNLTLSNEIQYNNRIIKSFCGDYICNSFKLIIEKE